MEAEQWRQPASLLSFPASCVVTATIILTIIIIIKDLDSKGEHISKKGQVIINTTQHLPSAVQPQRPLLMFSHSPPQGGGNPSFPFLPTMEKLRDREVKQGTRGSATACHV